MARAVSDLSLYYKINNGKLSGSTGNFVEENFNASDQKVQNDAMINLTMFESKLRQYDNFTFFCN